MTYEDHFDPEKDDPELRARLREIRGELGPRSRGPHVKQRLIARRNEPIHECARCGNAIPAGSGKGRPRLYCSTTCRKAAYEDRRAHRDGAVRVQLVDRVMVETRERVIRADHPMQTCIDNVLDDTQVTWRLLRELSRRIGTKRITPDDDVFWDLYGSVEYLHEAFIRSAELH